jgi:hypothetical protein
VQTRGRCEVVAQALEDSFAQQPIIADAAVFDFRIGQRFHPRRLWLL